MRKPVKSVTFHERNYPALIHKLNAVAINKQRSAHQLANIVLQEWLDDQIDQLGIHELVSQAARAV